MAAQALAGRADGTITISANLVVAHSLAGRADGKSTTSADLVHRYTDFAIICGLSTDGEPDDWLHLGVPVHPQEIWELQFWCCHKSGAPNAIVVGSFVLFDNKGNYVSTTKGPIANVVDSTAWTFYSFQYQFTTLAYVFPAIWWHGAGLLRARYLSAMQMASVPTSGGTAVVLQPDIFLTLGTTGKTLGSTKAILGPSS